MTISAKLNKLDTLNNAGEPKRVSSHPDFRAFLQIHIKVDQVVGLCSCLELPRVRGAGRERGYS